MWSFSPQEDQSLIQTSSGSTPNRKSMRFQRKRGVKSITQRSNTVVIKAAMEEGQQHTPSLHEEGGIEVSLKLNNAVESREPFQRVRREPVIDIKNYILLMNRVHISHFSVTFPALQEPEFKIDGIRPRGHRIPLTGSISSELSYFDALNVLQNSRVADEYSAVTQELEELNTELKELEKHRIVLQNGFRNAEKNPNGLPASRMRHVRDEWDVHKMLEEPSKHISAEQNRILQTKRGDFLTFYFQSYKAKEVFLSKCNAKLSQVKSNRRRAQGDTITLGAHNCKQGGAAAYVQHIAITSNTKIFKTGFFFSFDSNKSQNWGRLPQKLFRRIKDDTDGHRISDLLYLSSGPQGSYYAEFRSGDCWWGSAVDIDDLHSILEEWDVYRVIFGQIDSFEDERGDVKMTNSWIILGRDGRVAWKNVPTRLQNQLKSRLAIMSAPAEVSLGPGGSYFIRFLDGTVDYCLPAEIAEVCEDIERRGGEITNITLHPEISHDFVIRHTALSIT